jgi:hypothetical protein
VRALPEWGVFSSNVPWADPSLLEAKPRDT